MDSHRLGRLHWLMDQLADRELTPIEQSEYDSLCDEYKEDEWAYIRRMNAAANLPLDTEPFS
jgi:hypothetical protein